MRSDDRKTNMRIFVGGPGGVGKTTYAKMLANKYDLPYHELDNIRWPDGNKLTDEDFRKQLKKITSKESWIIEGTLKNTQDIIFPRATKIVVLSASRSICTYRVLVRTVRRAFGLESTIFNEMDDLFSLDFMPIRVWRNYWRYVNQLEDAIKETEHSAQIVRKKYHLLNRTREK